MKTKNIIGTIIISLLFASCPTKGSSREASDSIIMSALSDELYRNFENLHAEGFDKPFFIAYTLADAKITYSSATLGALNNSGVRNFKDWNVRVMVGDYSINDENFSGNREDEAVYLGSIDMPVEADYHGIRRSLWLTTDRVYNSAAKTYKNKMALIEHKQLTDSDLEIPDFSQAPVVKYSEPSPVSTCTKKEVEDLTRELSALFKNYPEIYNSGVSTRVFESTVYFINSEGTKVQYPFYITTVSISAATMTEDSQKIKRHIAYYVHDPHDLPDIVSIKGDIISFVENLLDLRTAQRYNDEYDGPVLLLGDVVAQNFSRALFNGPNNLIAYRESLQSSRQMNMYYEKSNNSLEGKIGKMVISKNLTVQAEPQLEEYNNIPLFGSYKVDAEGVMAPKKLMLIDTGKLVTLLNGRTPTRNVSESNGHMRFSYGFGGLTKQVGPGVLRITAKETQSIDSLKHILLKKASELGLDYAIIIRSIDVSCSAKPYEVYKVSTATGEEQLLRSVQLHSSNIRSLKRVLGVSDNEIVYNSFLSLNSRNEQGGIPVSFIVPNALLLEDFEMESYQKPLTSNLPIVENPVGNTEKSTIRDNRHD